MQLGMIGLGRMGANMVRRLMAGGHECVAHDVSEDAIADLEGEGARGARTLEEFVAALAAPRHVWIMVPAAFVGRDRRSTGAAARKPATRSSTAATAGTTTTSTAAVRCFATTASTTSTSARAAGSTASNGATA